jgi:hypothetical protein
VKQVTPQNVRDVSPDEPREGGTMEACAGIGMGIAGLGVLGPRREGRGNARAYYRCGYDSLGERKACPHRGAKARRDRRARCGQRDGRLEFVAQIGRLFVSKFFYTFQMQIDAQLEL